MGKILLRRKAVSRIILKPTSPGQRAVFLVEAQGRTDRQKVRELFQTVGEMAEVVQLSDGEVMSYAVQVRGNLTLFAKIEEVLKEEFAFSIVERSFSDVTYHLIESLCEDSKSRLTRVPHCGICGQADPFPTRVTMQDEQERAVIEAHYCTRCAAQQSDPSSQKFLVDLLSADRRNFQGIREARLIQSPLAAESADTTAYAIAS
jgi:hypothetical protein